MAFRPGLSPLEALLHAVWLAVGRAAGGAPTDCPEVRTLDRLLDGAFEPREVEPAGTPVVARHLAAAAAGAATDSGRGIARALLAASPALRWIAPYDGAPGAGDLAGAYAGTMLVGTGAPFRDYQTPFVSPDLVLVLTLQAPQTLYPAHRHPAAEVYHVISGTAEWQRGDEPWRGRPPGDWFFHPGGCPHATRTGAEPLLALAAWIDHVDGPPPALEPDG